MRNWARVRPGQTVLVNRASSRPPWSTCSPSGGLRLLGLNHSLLLGAVADRARDAPLRLLLPDPDSAAARQRAIEIGGSPESFAGGMLQPGLRRTLEDLRKHAKRIIWIIICR